MHTALSETTAKNSSFSTETPLGNTPKQFFIEASFRKADDKSPSRPSSSRQQSTTATSTHKVAEKAPQKKDEFSFTAQRIQTIPSERLRDTDFSPINRLNSEQSHRIRASTPNPGSSRLLQTKGSTPGGMKAQKLSLDLKTTRPSSKASTNYTDRTLQSSAQYLITERAARNQLHTLESQETPRMQPKRPSSLIRASENNSRSRIHNREANLLREYKANQLIREHNFPNWCFSKGMSIDEKELMVQKLLISQINDDIHQHDLMHSERKQKNKSAYKEHSGTTDERKKLFDRLDSPTKYVNLKDKVLDEIIEQNIAKRDILHFHKPIVNRHRKTLINPPTQIEISEFNDKKLRYRNNDKAIGLVDIVEKKQFNNWFENNVQNVIFGCVEAFEDRYTTSLLNPKERKQNYESNILSQSRDIRTTSTTSQGGLKGFFSKKIYGKELDRQFRRWQIRNATNLSPTSPSKLGGIRHTTYHPQSWSPDYHSFLAVKRRYSEELAAEGLRPSLKALFKKAVNIIRLAQAFKKSKIDLPSKNWHRKLKSNDLKSQKEVEEAEIKTEQKYRPVYRSLKWNEAKERDYEVQQQLAFDHVPKGDFRTAHAYISLSYFKKDPLCSVELEKIQNEDYENKRAYYGINNHTLNRKKFQEELHNIDKEELSKIELKVSNNILAKYTIEKDVLQKTRRGYLKAYYKKQKEDLAKKPERKEAKERFKKEFQEHVWYTKQIRNVLEQRNQGKITKQDDEFTKTHIFQESKKTYSKLGNLEKISDMVKAKRAAEEALGRGSRSQGNSATNSPKNSGWLLKKPKNKREVLMKAKDKYKMTYTGGPRIITVAQGTKYHSLEMRISAAVRLQAFTRGFIARRRFLMKKEMKIMTERKEREDNFRMHRFT